MIIYFIEMIIEKGHMNTIEEDDMIIVVVAVVVVMIVAVA